MGALRDADGKVIGSGGCGRHVCSRSAHDRHRHGCQTAAMGTLTFDEIPHCPKTQAFRDHTCEKKVGDKTMARINEAQRRIVNDSLRRHGITLARDGVAVPLSGYAEGAGSMDMDALREALEEMGIMADDIEKVIARLSDTGGVDSAPSDMGSGIQAGGGSTRTYAPEETPTGSTFDRGRRMAGDAATHVQRVMAHRQRQYAAGQISHADLYRPVAPATLATDEKGFNERFPDAARLGFSTYHHRAS